MPGANYMGGKRHAAKAREKDAVGKIQKGYFGRQKLDVLSKSLSTNRVHEGLRRGVKDDAANKISLAHAKKKPMIEEDDDFYSYIPSPTRPTIRARNYGSSSAHTSSPNPRHSKILMAIDTNDPSFLRKTLDDILALPDLAYLHSWGSTKNRSRRKGAERSLAHNFAVDSRHGERVGDSCQNKSVKSTIPRDSWSPLSSPRHNYTISDDLNVISDVDDNYPLQRGGSSASRESMDHDQELPATHVNPVGLTSPSTLDATSESGIPARVNLGPAAFGELFNEINPWEKLGEILGFSSATKPVEDTEAAQHITPSPLYECQPASQEDAEMKQRSILTSTDVKDGNIVPDSQHSSIESNMRSNSADEMAGAVYVSGHEQDFPLSPQELLGSQGQKSSTLFSMASQISGSPRPDSLQARTQGAVVATDFQLVGPDNVMEDIFDDIFDDGLCLQDAVDDCSVVRSNSNDVQADTVSHGDVQSSYPSHNLVGQEIALREVQTEETLRIPELAELDGKYIGPTLFYFSESEEE